MLKPMTWREWWEWRSGWSYKGDIPLFPRRLKSQCSSRVDLSGQLQSEEWRAILNWFDGPLHREDGPAWVHYVDGLECESRWYMYGNLHGNSFKEPAVKKLLYKGVWRYEWWYKGYRHCFEDHPSEVEYTLDGKVLVERWHNKQDQLHREGCKPAEIIYDPETWKAVQSRHFVSGRLHNSFGPAVYYGDGRDPLYYEEGRRVVRDGGVL